MPDNESLTLESSRRTPWNKGKLDEHGQRRLTASLTGALTLWMGH